MVQGELFIDEKNDLRTQSASFFSARKISLTLDKIILISIAFLILFALTFSFGYERGKRATEKRIQALTSHIETVTPIPVPTAPAILNEASFPAEQIAVETSTPDMNTPVETDSAMLDEGAPLEDPTLEAPVVAEVEAAATPDGKYTIQVATAVNQESAEREVKKLEKKGHKAFFIQRGKFYEVCIGSFETVKSAKPLLTEIKAAGPYGDAFVRPLH